MTLDQVRLTDNRATVLGGAIYAGANLTITRSTIDDNRVPTNVGGGIYFDAGGKLVIRESTIAGNSATYGAGVFINPGRVDAFEISGSTFYDNTASSIGGGLFIQKNVATAGVGGLIVNSTISGNHAANSGGVRVSYGAVLQATNTTIAGNHGNFGGGLTLINSMTETTPVTIHNSIVAENRNGSDTGNLDVYGTLQTGSTRNLLGLGGAGGLSGPANIVLAGAETPGLAALADNGGPTWTHALEPGSKAINNGSDVQAIAVGVLADQRGAARYIGPVDIGSYEVGLPTSAPTADEWGYVLKNENTGFGFGWDLASVDRVIAAPASGVAVRWVRSDGYLVDFDAFNSTSTTGVDATASKISNSNSTYFIRQDKFGNKSYYLKTTGVLVKAVDRLGVGYEYAYGDHDGDSQARELESVTLIRPGQLGETWTFAYPTTGITSRIASVTDPFGRTADLAYNGSGFLTEIQLPAPNPSFPAERPTFTFDYASGFLSSITDADGHETAFEFSVNGELTISYPDGGQRRQLPVIDDVFAAWRSQLGAWKAVLPEFKYKVSIEGISGTKNGYEVDQLGRVSTFKINELGHITEMIDAAGNKTEYVLNSAGLAVEVTVSASGSGAIVSRTEYTYDAKFNLIGIEYFDETMETWDYDDDFSQLIEHVDQLGRRTRYDVDPITGNTLEKRIVVGLDDRDSSEYDDVVTQYEYEDDGLLSAVIRLRKDVDGTPLWSFVTLYAYTNVSNTAGHVGRWWLSTSYGGDDPGTSGIVLTNPSDIVVIDRNDFGMPTRIVNEFGLGLERQTEYEYDDLDRLTKVISPDPGYGQHQPVTEYEYRLSGLLEEVTQTRVGGGSGDRITTHFGYDAVGRLSQVVQDSIGPKQAATSYVYDLAGNVTHVTDALEHTTQYVYNVLNLPIAVIEEDPDGESQPLTSPVTLFAYDPLRRAIGTRDAEGALTRWERDELGRIAREIRPLGVTTDYVYDGAGQLREARDALGRTTEYAWDEAGRLATMQAPGHAAAFVYQYDSAGNLRFITDPLNHAVEKRYDERGRVVQEFDANGHATLYGYYGDDRLHSLTDPAGNVTAWTYDGAGRLRSETNEYNDARTYKYDAYGRLQEKVDRLGRITRYEYDTLHHLAAEKWYDGVTLERTIAYDFDAVGNLREVSDPVATYAYQYDNLNRQISVTQTIAGLSASIVIDKQYDAEGRRVGLQATIGATADFANQYVYDAAGRLTRLVQTGRGGNDVAPKRVDFAYNAANQWTSINRYASTTTANAVVETTFGYDAFGRLEAILHAGSTFLEEHHYGFDGANRISWYSDNVVGYEAAYEYDNRGQLLEVDTVSIFHSSESYEYDANGNRVGVYSTDPANRLASDWTFEYTYDDEGNRIARVHLSYGSYTQYQWDHRNRLVDVTEYDSTDVEQSRVTYAYDAFNQLVRRDESTQAGQRQTSYVHDDGQIVLQFDKTGAGAIQSSDLSHRYVWADVVDQLLADEQVHDLADANENETLWAMTDHLGSVRQTVDSAGQMRMSRYFEAFGNACQEWLYDAEGNPVYTGDPGATSIAFAFTGRLFDATTGLQNNLHRWYDPTVGRWLSEDPIGFAAGDSNLYRYVQNQVTILQDPSGEFPYYSWGWVPGRSINQDGSEKEAGQQYEEILNRQQKQRQGKSKGVIENTEGSKQSDRQELEEAAELALEELRRRRQLESEDGLTAAEAVGWTAVIVGAGYFAWQGAKWTAAVIAAPETGGISIGIAIGTP